MPLLVVKETTRAQEEKQSYQEVGLRCSSSRRWLLKQMTERIDHRADAGITDGESLSLNYTIRSF